MWAGCPLSFWRTIVDWKRLNPPPEIADVLRASPKLTLPDSVQEMVDQACGGKGSNSFDVSFEVPGKGSVLEATVARVRNGVVANYPDPYMRRRDPDCMVIADDLPTDKPHYKDLYKTDFSPLRKQTLEWLSKQELTVFAFTAGQYNMGLSALVLAPSNAGFFALGLAMLQKFIPISQVPAGFAPKLILYVAPPFRHTHFQGKQMVVHDRKVGMHEMFAYNLYPGPSAKKGAYSGLLFLGEQEGWVTTHCSTVQVVTPYDNVITLMHEGASGGGKSEMLEHAHREMDGRVLLGENVKTGESYPLTLPRFCELQPVTDDMALCHPSLQTDNQKLSLVDAEDSWFVRVNHITHYATDPILERLTAEPPEPLLFLNIDAVPGSRALLWEHMEDKPGKPCPNPRVVIPRRIIPKIVNEPVSVDIRSFGVRTPPCTKEKPSYGILGLFHVLPPSLGWLWRLVAPRGYSNPSIVDSEEMSSEGVGSYWPFATGRRVDQANLLLEQIRKTPKVQYILCPNQHVGAWKTDFMPQWVAREYLARHGSAKFKKNQVTPARCTLLGLALQDLTIEGVSVPKYFLQVHQQPEVGEKAYDEGAEILFRFFEKHLRAFLVKDLSLLGKKIIETCLSRGTLKEYDALLPSL